MTILYHLGQVYCGYFCCPSADPDGRYTATVLTPEGDVLVPSDVQFNDLDLLMQVCRVYVDIELTQQAMAALCKIANSEVMGSVEREFESLYLGLQLVGEDEFTLSN